MVDGVVDWGNHSWCVVQEPADNGLPALSGDMPGADRGDLLED